jgi:hypothetical protein
MAACVAFGQLSGRRHRRDKRLGGCPRSTCHQRNDHLYATAALHGLPCVDRQDCQLGQTSWARKQNFVGGVRRHEVNLVSKKWCFEAHYDLASASFSSRKDCHRAKPTVTQAHTLFIGLETFAYTIQRALNLLTGSPEIDLVLVKFSLTENCHDSLNLVENDAASGEQGG